MDTGADIDRSINGLTALSLSASLGRAEAVKLLLEKGADPRAKNQAGLGILHLAATIDPAKGLGRTFRQLIKKDFKADYTAVVDMLVEAGLDVDAVANGRTPLSFAALRGNTDVAAALIRRGANIEFRDEAGFTPLISAAESGYDGLLRMLLDHRADVNTTNNVGKAAIMVAASFGRETCIPPLLQAGADVKTFTADGFTPLHGAAMGGWSRASKCLLDAGADVNARCAHASELLAGSTALHMSCLRTHFESLGVEKSAGAEDYERLQLMLLEAGADPNAKDRGSETPLHLAVKYGDSGAVTNLLAADADPNYFNKKGWTPLHYAVSRNLPDVARQLLSAGADPERQQPPAPSARELAVKLKREGLMLVMAQPGSRPEVVGLLGEPRHISFSGNRTFPDKAIRKGLRQCRSYMMAAHPDAPFEAFLRELKGAVTRGYLKAGFPDVAAGVETEADAQRPGVRVTIKEGPRYKNGPVAITGGKTNLYAAIERRLQRGESFASIDTGPADPLMKAAADQLKQEPAPEKEETPDPTWEEGEYTAFHPEQSTHIEKEILRACADQGYLFAKAKAELKPDRDTGATELQVWIDETGPLAKLRNITIKGLTGNVEPKRAAVSAMLELESGARFDHRKLQEARQRLYHSARFTKAKIRHERVDPHSSQVDLVIELSEFPNAPPIGTQLSPEQQILLKAREWMIGWPQGDEDLVLTLTINDDVEADRLVLSPTKGMISTGHMLSYLLDTNEPGLFGEARGPDRKPGPDMVIWLGPDRTGFCVPGTDTHLGLPGLADLTLCMEIKPPDEPDEKFMFMVGSRFSSIARPVALTWDIRIHPVCIHKFSEYQCDRSKDGLVYTYEGTNGVQSIHFDATGRLREFTYRDTQRGNRVVALRLVPERGAYDRIQASTAQATVAIPNAYDPQRPVSSMLTVLAGLVEKMADGWEKAPDGSAADQLRQGAGAVKYLVDRGLFSPLDKEVSTRNSEKSDKGSFTIPARAGQPPIQNMMLFLIATLTYGEFADLFPADSWPVTLTRESMYIGLGYTRYSGQVFEGLYRDNAEIGPLGYFFISAFMKFINPSLSPRFAQRGLEGLSAADFEKDWRLFLPEDAEQRKHIVDILTSLPELKAENREILEGLLGSELAKLSEDFLDTLRQHRGEPLRQVLSPALAPFWDSGLRTHVEQLLTKAAAGVATDSALIAATVNGTPIEWSTIDLMVGAQIVRSGNQSREWIERKQREVFQSLVMCEMVYQDFLNTHADGLPGLTDRLIEELVQTQLQGDWDGLSTYLNNQAMSRPQLERALLMAHLMQKRADEVAQPSEEEMQVYFKENQKSFVRPKDTTHLHMITVPVDSDNPVRDRAAQKAHIEKIRAAILGGEEFGEQAKKYSKDHRAAAKGCHGDVAVENLGGPVKTIAETIELNQTSEVIEWNDCFFLIQITSRKPASVPTFADVRSDIESRLLHARQQTAIHEWMKDLQKRTEIRTFQRSKGQ